jgi:uncharacterized protein YlxP (DUF503 family)
MLQTCLEFMLIQFRLYNPNSIIQKNQVTRPILSDFRIFSDYEIRIGEKLNFLPYNKGKHLFGF